MTDFNDMQLVKRRFFAMRNGALAEQLRQARVPYRIIFGLNLPQIVEIAADFAPSVDLAERLWANSTTRESLLIAPMLYPRDEMDYDTALRWATTAPSAEVVDILCHRLLRHLPVADALADTLIESERPIDRYAALRLMFNKFPQRMDLLEERARAEASRAEPLTSSLSRLILDEISYMRG